MKVPNCETSVLQQMLLLISLRESEFRKDGLDSASSYPDPQFSSKKIESTALRTTQIFRGSL